MLVIDGKKIAEDILGRLKSLPKPKKFFGAVLVGEDPASVSFLKQKEKVAYELGIDFRLYTLSAELKNDDLRAEVRKLAEHKTCGGFIVQLPLPEHINKHYILNVIPRERDVDVLSERALGAFYAGRNPVLPPATGTVKEILDFVSLQLTAYELTSLSVAVVGLGLLVGKPIAVWLMAKAKEVYLLHRGSDLGLLKSVDLVISGVGQAGLIKPEMLKDGAGVIDFGYSIREKSEKGKVKSELAGDFDSSLLTSRSSLITLRFYTPTPGGTGPILVAKLFENFYKLNEKS